MKCLWKKGMICLETMIWICFEICSSVQDTANDGDTGNEFLAVT
jgi:hypothetical protein